MASTYLTLVNNVLRDFNEVELTSSNFGSSRGVQTTVKDYINRSITDLINSELNWPFTQATGSIDVIAGKQLYSHASIASTLKYVDYDNMFLKPKNYITNGTYEVSGSASITGWTTVSGSPAASSKFGNTLLLTSAKVTQEISDLIVGRSYIILTQTSGGTLTLDVGTSSGGSQTKSATLTVSNANEVSLNETTFTATAITHFVSFTEAAGSAAYDEIGLTPIPDTSNRTLEFDYYVSHTDLSSATDTSIIPTRFEPVIISRAKYYTHLFRSDVQSAQFSLKEYDDGIKRMKVELLNRKNYMRAV
jgi:hypothetical protein